MFFRIDDVGDIAIPFVFGIAAQYLAYHIATLYKLERCRSILRIFNAVSPIFYLTLCWVIYIFGRTYVLGLRIETWVLFFLYSMAWILMHFTYIAEAKNKIPMPTWERRTIIAFGIAGPIVMLVVESAGIRLFLNLPEYIAMAEIIGIKKAGWVINARMYGAILLFLIVVALEMRFAIKYSNTDWKWRWK